MLGLPFTLILEVSFISFLYWSLLVFLLLVHSPCFCGIHTAVTSWVMVQRDKFFVCVLACLKMYFFFLFVYMIDWLDVEFSVKDHFLSVSWRHFSIVFQLPVFLWLPPSWMLVFLLRTSPVSVVYVTLRQCTWSSLYISYLRVVVRNKPHPNVASTLCQAEESAKCYRVGETTFEGQYGWDTDRL